MLLPNFLFRMGSAAILLSKKCKDQRCAKYKLIHVVRIHKVIEDKEYRCVYQEEYAQGKVRTSLSRDLMAIVGDALKENITTLDPLVMLVCEQLLFKKENFEDQKDVIDLHGGRSQTYVILSEISSTIDLKTAISMIALAMTTLCNKMFSTEFNVQQQPIIELIYKSNYLLWFQISSNINLDSSTNDLQYD